VQKHQKMLTHTISLVTARPEACPLAQNIRGPCTAAHRLIHAKLDFDYSRSSTFASNMPNRDDLAKKNDTGLIGHSVQRIFDSDICSGIGSNSPLPIPKRRHKQNGLRQPVQTPPNFPHDGASVLSFLLRQKGAGIVQAVNRERNQRSRYGRVLNLRVKIEERIQTHTQLGFNLLPASFEDMHRYSGRVSVLQSDWSVAHLCYLVGWQQPHSINQCQVCHKSIVSPKWNFNSLSPLFLNLALSSPKGAGRCCGWCGGCCNRCRYHPLAFAVAHPFVCPP
jgi:hypothetical protein